jgi:long-subunit fatty acid transport protein
MTAALAAALYAGAADASGPLETFGADPASKAMANARTGGSPGAASAHYNPAALARVERPELTFGFSLVLPGAEIELATEPAEGIAPRPLDPTAIWSILGAFPLAGILEDRLYAGFTLGQPVDIYMYARSPDPSQPFIYRYDSYAEHFDLEPAIALKWFDWLATGVGIRVGAMQRGRIELSLDPLRREVTRQAIDAAQVPFSTPTAGVTLGPFGWDSLAISAGFAYRERLSTPLSIISILEVDGLDLDMTLPVTTVSNFSPRSFHGGLDVAFLGSGHASVDVEYAVWSEAPTPYLGLQAGIGGELVGDLGLEGELDSPGPGLSRIRSAGFVDTMSVRAGLEYWFLDELIALRGGYGYRPTPVPDQTSGSNIADANAHIVAGGVGMRVPMPFLDEPLRFDGAWQSQLLETRTTNKELADDPTGTWRLKGAMHELSVALGYAW